MAEIATWSAILNKTGLGKTSNECPTKAELLALNNGKDSNVDKVIVISNAASYGNNECVKLEDINAEQWIYTFQWDQNGNPSFNAPATGGTYPFGSYASNRVKQVNGVNTTISQSLANDVTKTSEGSWYTTDYDGNKGRIVPNNTSTNSKSITVTWTQKYSGKTIQATFTQAAGRKVYSSWNYNCRVDKTSFSYSGGQSNVTAKSASRTYTWNGQGSSYTESETATVRVSSPASISGNSISIPSNSGSARNFTVTFDFPTATDQTTSISQEGGQVTYVDHLSISPTTKNVPGTGSEFRLTVNANYDKYINGTYVENVSSTYTSAEVVEGTSSDITISGKTSSGCSISVAPNPNSSPRTFKIKFTYDTATPVYLTITQNSAEVTYPSSGIVFEHSTQQNSGYKTSTLSIGTVEGKGGNISFYIKSYRSRYVNGSLSSTEAIKPTLILPSGVTETITNVSGYYFKVTITIPEHSKPASRTLTIRANQPNGLDRELVQTVQQSASTYEFGIRENSGDSLSTSLTYSGWPSSDSSFNRPVRVYSRKNGNQFLNWALSSNVDWITISGSGAGATYKVATNNSSSSRTGIITFTQGESGKTCTLTIVQEGGQVTYVDHLSISPTTKNVPGTGSEFRLTVNANYDKYINGTYVENVSSTYTSAEVVEGTSSDITISGKTSSGCSISVAPNPNSSPRTFKIKFTYDTATPVYLTITQNSAEVTYPSSGIVFEHSTQQNSGYKTSTLSIGTVEGKGGNISFYIKSYRSRYVNGSLSSTEAIKPTLILPSGVTETITNVSGYYFKVTITIPEHSKPASRTLTIRANQPNGLDRELVQTVQQSASTYEFGIRENSGDSLSTSLTYSGWPSSDSSFNRPVRVYSRKNGNQFLNWALSSNVDWITISGSGAGATYKVATNNSSSSRTGIITFTQGESGKTCTLTIVQEAGDVYEFYITDSDGNGHYTDFTFSAPSNGLANKHVLNLISTHNGSPLSADDMEGVHSEMIDKLIGLVLTPDTQSPFRFMANITENGYTERTGADTYRQKASGKTVIFRVLQEAKNNNFRLELSLNISNGNDQDTWGLFDTANMPHTSDFMYSMSLIREGIIVDSVEGKITVNSIQSTTKDRGIGDDVYVWAYNSVRGLWLSIGNFRIEEGNNTHHWDVSWPT